MAAQRARYLQGVLWEEFGGYHPRYWLPGLLAKFLPVVGGGRLRSGLYRACGVSIGPGTLLGGPITFGASLKNYANIRVGARCFLNSPLFIDTGAPVSIGDGVAIGHHVVIITTDHAIGTALYRAGDIRCKPVTVESGAWIAAGVTLLPGVTVGAGAIVAAGAVVTRDVPPNTLAAGVPAKVIRSLDAVSESGAAALAPLLE